MLVHKTMAGTSRGVLHVILLGSSASSHSSMRIQPHTRKSSCATTARTLLRNCRCGPYKVPALYFSNYSRAIDVADELSLVRPDQSYRGEIDEACQTRLDNPLAVYMVYTLEEGDDRWVLKSIGEGRRVHRATPKRNAGRLLLFSVHPSHVLLLDESPHLGILVARKRDTPPPNLGPLSPLIRSVRHSTTNLGPNSDLSFPTRAVLWDSQYNLKPCFGVLHDTCADETRQLPVSGVELHDGRVRDRGRRLPRGRGRPTLPLCFRGKHSEVRHAGVRGARE